MGYVKVMWPESQALMSLTDEEMEEYGIELGDDCSYFVPEEDYDEVYAIAEDRMRQEIENSRSSELPWDYGKHFD
jgi:hypothetical protein